MLYSNAVIDWLSVVMNGFWIVGTAVLLAAFSYQYSQTEPPSLKERLEQKSFLRPFWAGMACIALGLAGTSSTWWETALWGLLMLISLMNIIKPK
jgi:hypothetical protein